jgi:hypothetical protein
LHLAADDPKSIERLGKYFALLGPRFKTIDRQAMLDRAECKTSNFHRRLQHQREIGALPMDPLKDLPKQPVDLDGRPDTALPRREWLTRRAKHPRRPEEGLELLQTALEELAWERLDQ